MRYYFKIDSRAKVDQASNVVLFYRNKEEKKQYKMFPCDPHMWDQNTQQIKGRSIEVMKKNLYLQRVKMNIQEYITNCNVDSRPVN